MTRCIAQAILLFSLLALPVSAGTPWGLDMKEGDNLVFDPSVPGGLKGEPAITPSQPLPDYCTRKGRITFTPQGRIYVCPAGGNSAPVGATTGEGATDYTTLTPGAPATFGKETLYDEAGTGHYQEGPAGDINLLLNTGTAVVIGQESTSTTDRLPLWKFDRDTKAFTLLNGATGPAATALSIAGQAQGDVLYFNGTNWVKLAPGTSGQFLKTLGAGANPAWDAATAANAVTVLLTTASSVLVSNTLTETTLFSITVSGNTLDTDGCLRITLNGILTNNATDTQTLRVKYGTAVLTWTVDWGTVTNFNTTVSGHFCNNGATNSQRGVFTWARGGDPTITSGVRNTFAIDSTVNQTLLATMQLSVANEVVKFEKLIATVEHLP